MIGLEERRFQGVQQTYIVDIYVGIVDKHTGLHIAFGVDVEIPPAAGDAAAHIFAVVLEVQGEDGLGGAEGADGMVHFGPLLRGGQQLHGGVVAHGHIVEEPGEQGTAVNELVKVPFAAYVVHIAAGIAGGDAEGQIVGVQQSHDRVDLLIDTLSPPGVVCGLKALQGDGGDKVFHPQHLLTESLVDQSAVGKGQEHTVRVHFAELYDVPFAYQRLAAGVNVHIGAQLFALGDDRVQIIQAQVELVTVFRRPAAGAVHIAGGGGVQQDGPGDVAVLPLADLLLDGAALQTGIEQEVLSKGLPHPHIQLEEPQDQLIPVVLFLNSLAEGIPLRPVPVGRGIFVKQLHELGDVFLRIAVQITKNLIDGKPLHGVFYGIAHIIHPFRTASQFSAIITGTGNRQRLS